jgi:hypothetical protein
MACAVIELSFSPNTALNDFKVFERPLVKVKTWTTAMLVVTMER